MNTTPINLQDIAFKKIGDYAAAPTVVFLHDSLGCIEVWRDFPEQLAAMTSCNVVIYDRQGYGKSCEFSYDKRDNDYLEQEADILNDLLAYWNIDQVILFGHSDGGSIALLAAAKYPDKILGVITEGAHVFVEDITVKGIREAIDLYQTTDLKSRLEKYHGDKTDKMFWAWAETWTTSEFSQWNIERFLPQILCPVLIIQGKADEYGSLAQVESIVNQVSGIAGKYIVPKAKHTPHKELPDLILKKASDFIQQIR